MNLFRNKYKINWKFSQKGNLWKILFAGNEIICGETRDTEHKEAYYFALNFRTGEIILNNYIFENNNFWVTLEDANKRFLFLSRFEQPGMPNNKGIIAIDFFTREIIWENTELEFLFNTEDYVYAYKQNYESTDIFRIDSNTGKNIIKISNDENNNIYKLREETISSKYDEIYDYPSPPGKNSDNSVFDILKEEIKDSISESNPELIEREDIVIFNYYRNRGLDLKNITKKNFSNIICIYDKATKKLLYRDLLNEDTAYCLPDNFFTKEGYLYYIKEKKELINIKL